MRFYKYEGLGNDYVLLENMDGRIEEKRKSALAQELCDRRLGIGADGLLLVEKGREGSEEGLAMRIFNSDGSEAEMCGNGIRCFAKYLHDHVGGKGRYSIQTKAGTQEAVIEGDSITIRMPEPVDDGNVDLGILGSSLQFRKVSVGNPHAVVFGTFKNWKEIGEIVENDSHFPNRTNVEFAEVLDAVSCNLLVWERGAGPTLACGTGAVAACFAGSLEGIFSRDEWISVKLPGGVLEAKTGKETLLRGPATEVFSGEKTI